MLLLDVPAAVARAEAVGHAESLRRELERQMLVDRFRRLFRQHRCCRIGNEPQNRFLFLYHLSGPRLWSGTNRANHHRSLFGTFQLAGNNGPRPEVLAPNPYSICF